MNLTIDAHEKKKQKRGGGVKVLLLSFSLSLFLSFSLSLNAWRKSLTRPVTPPPILCSLDQILLPTTPLNLCTWARSWSAPPSPSPTTSLQHLTLFPECGVSFPLIYHPNICVPRLHPNCIFHTMDAAFNPPEHLDTIQNPTCAPFEPFPTNPQPPHSTSRKRGAPFLSLFAAPLLEILIVPLLTPPPSSPLFPILHTPPLHIRDKIVIC